LKDLADVHFSAAQMIVLIQDNPRRMRSIRPPTSTAMRRSTKPIQPPTQCLDRRISDKQTLVEEIAAWQHERNANHAKAIWHFTTTNARIKLKHLYPLI
jgi:hypothetical protein